MLNHLNISSAWTASYFLPDCRLSVVSPGSQAQQKDLTCRWTLLFGGCSSTVRSRYKKQQNKKKGKANPINGIPIDARNSRRFAWQDFGKRMETGATFSKQVNIKQAQSESNPAPDKKLNFWTGGCKLKVWLLVEMGLLEVTSGKCLCLAHFTAYSHLTSDFLTGSKTFILV